VHAAFADLLKARAHLMDEEYHRERVLGSRFGFLDSRPGYRP
jgi:hypothetical protein